MDFSGVGFGPCDLLLPAPGTDLSRWSCVACDQYTSQPEYWQQVSQYVGDAPSTLHLMLPEVYLHDADTLIPQINAAQQAAMENGSLTQQVTDGFVLVERTTESGCRIGLVGAVDLEAYSFESGSKPLIRPTEQTVRSRLPARAAIRRKAPLEMSHVMMLMDDPRCTVVEPIYERRHTLRLLYDFNLMQGGGHLRGWAVESDTDKQLLLSALESLKSLQGEDPLLFAVGDGNHSLATAKTCWEELKTTHSPEELEGHPARYAMVEIENIHCPALQFEPIHRVMTNVVTDALLGIWGTWASTHGMGLVLGEADGHHFRFVMGNYMAPSTLTNPYGALEVETVQRFLDLYAAQHRGVEIDYIHGEDVVLDLCKADPSTVGILLPALKKDDFFRLLGEIGTMPRKTFSMGEAHEKRYYMECRKIR